MKTILFLIILSGLLIVLNAARPRSKTAGRKPENKPQPDPAPDAKALAPEDSAKCNCRQAEDHIESEHPLIKVINLTRQIEAIKKEVEALPEDPATLSERRILKEQVRMATFERDLLLSVYAGHHPNPSAIDTDWCFKSAELYLKFARDRLDRIP